MISIFLKLYWGDVAKLRAISLYKIKTSFQTHEDQGLYILIQMNIKGYKFLDHIW